MIFLNIAPTHRVATWLLNTIDDFLNHLGLDNYTLTKEIIYILIISLLSAFIGILIKKFVLFVVKRIMAIKQTDIAKELLARHVFTKCSHIIPPLVFLALIPFAFTSDSVVLKWIYRVVGVYTLVAFGMGISAILRFIFDRYNERDNRQNHPLKGVLNVSIGIVWIIIVILAFSIVFHKSPATLLAGLGAFAAALMLIFKDSILGFVAGIQMSDNDMLRVGDWIVVPGTPANGIVQDVSLSTVKVQNWDLTTVMVPPYTLVSTSFQNYRSMYDANCRQIKNYFYINPESIVPTTPEMIENVCDKYPELKPFIANLQTSGKTSTVVSGLQAVNGSIETNLGLYRSYINVYLTAHPYVAKSRRVLVRVMETTNSGVPLQIWCFSDTSDWGEYEAIQSQIMEYLTSVAGDFGGLRIYSANYISLDAKGTEIAKADIPAPQSQSVPD